MVKSYYTPHYLLSTYRRHRYSTYPLTSITTLWLRATILALSLWEPIDTITLSIYRMSTASATVLSDSEYNNLTLGTLIHLSIHKSWLIYLRGGILVNKLDTAVLWSNW
jgi:hypothetical protein